MRPLLCLVVCWIGSVSAGAAEFDLIEASGIASGHIELVPGRLVVYQASGQRTYFGREPRYDSPDGQYVGYFNVDLNRVLRFPRSGSGSLQTADLDDVSPRYRNARYAVRPRAGDAVLGGPTVASGYRGYATAGYAPQLPQSVLIDSETIPNPPLPPARVTFGNDGPREIEITVVDLQDPAGTRKSRIPPGAAVNFDLVRDSGAKRVSHHSVVGPTGGSYTKEVVSEVPPSDRYEVVVHELNVQSVAIDRTARSPGRIEDINYQGKGIGRFMLPPGPQLTSGTIDVYSAARSQGNQGTIAPIVPKQGQSGAGASPLDRAILEAQRAAQGRN